MCDCVYYVFFCLWDEIVWGFMLVCVLLWVSVWVLFVFFVCVWFFFLVCSWLRRCDGVCWGVCVV